jgi:hypothetical protein
MNFQILLMVKYKTGTNLWRLMEMIQTFHQVFIMDYKDWLLTVMWIYEFELQRPTIG